MELSGISSAGLKRPSLEPVEPNSLLHTVNDEQIKTKCWSPTGHQLTTFKQIRGSETFLRDKQSHIQPSNPPYSVERRRSFTLMTSIGHWILS
jgi:hypothetical protein